MTYTGFNMSSIKTANRASVLYLLNGSKQLSRKDIAESLGLTPAAVSKICAELIAEGAINECGSLDCSAGAGRKKIILSLNSKEIFVLAIGIDKKGHRSRRRNRWRRRQGKGDNCRKLRRLATRRCGAKHP